MINIEIIGEAISFNQKLPRIKIFNNGLLIDDVECYDKFELKYKVNGQEKNTLSIELYNKSFGDNGVWDVNEKGEGLGLKITDIKFDDVSIDHLLFDMPFRTNWTQNQLLYESEEFKAKYTNFKSAGSMNFNGTIEFEYCCPVYEFLIDKKYKVPYDPSIAFYSNKTALFHYEHGLSIVKEIKKIIAANE